MARSQKVTLYSLPEFPGIEFAQIRRLRLDGYLRV